MSIQPLTNKLSTPKSTFPLVEFLVFEDLLQTLHSKAPRGLQSYLRDVDLGALGACHHHGLEVVELGEGFLGTGAGLVTSVIEDSVHLVLKGLAQGVSRCRLELIVVSFLNDVNYLNLGTMDSCRNFTPGLDINIQEKILVGH
jgi:hypothetical protein